MSAAGGIGDYFWMVCDRMRMNAYAINVLGLRGLGGAISCGGGPLVTVSGTAGCEDPTPLATIHLPTPGVAEKWRGSLADGGIYITHPPFPVLGRFDFRASLSPFQVLAPFVFAAYIPGFCSSFRPSRCVLKMGGVKCRISSNLKLVDSL